MIGRFRGRIISWSPSYGFIEPDDGSPEVFFCGASVAPHQDYMQLRRGDLVAFDLAHEQRPGKCVMATGLAWVIGAEPPLRELDRRAAREGDPETWRERNWRERNRNRHRLMKDAA